MPRLPFSPAAGPVAGALLSCLLLVGCGEGSPYAVDDAEATEGTGELPDGAVERALNPGDAGTVGEGNLTDGAPAEPVSAKPVSYEEFRTLVEEADGPVLVDCWAEWCAPCKRGFPHTVALAEKHADAGLTVISLAFNAEEEQEAVDAFLTKTRAAAVTNVRTDDPQADGWAALDVSGLPTLILYGADGEEAARVEGFGPDTTAELDAAVEGALAG